MDQDALFEKMLSQGHSLDMTVDADGKLRYVNPALSRALGLPAEQLRGMHWREVALPADAKALLEDCFKNVLEEKRSMITRMGISGGALPKHYECTVSPILDGDGKVGNITASFQDTTGPGEERELNAQVDEALLKLQSSYDIDRVVPQVLSDLVKTLDADIAAITLQQDGRWSPKYVARAGNFPEDRIFLEKHVDLAKEIAKQRSIFEIGSRPGGGRAADPDLTWGVRALVAVPLHVRGDVFGVLMIAHRFPVPPYGAARKNHLRKLGAALSLAFGEDRPFPSRESGALPPHSSVGTATMGMAILDGEGLRIKYSDKMYDDVVPERFRGANIMHMPSYRPASDAMATGPEALLREAQASDGPFVCGRIRERIGNGAMTSWQVVLVPSRGKSADIICLLIDITDWERSNRKMAKLITTIQEEQLQVRALLDSVPLGAYISNAEGHIVEMSRMGPQIWGNKVTLPRNIEEYGNYNGRWSDTGERLTTDDWPIARAVRKGETVIGAVIDYQSFDGKTGTIINSAAPIRDHHGKIVGAVEIDHDITEMKSLEKKLEAAKAHLEAVINQMPAGVAIAEAPSGRISKGNAALGQILPTGGRLPSDIQGYADWGLLDPCGLNPLNPEEHPLAKALLEKRTVSGEAVIRRANGKETTVLMSATPVMGPENKILGAVAIFTDISGQKEIEKRLEQQARDLARFNADLQRFAYVASNDLRESLKSLTNYLNLLEKSSS